ncbi:transposase [Streptomyces sp. HNM0574]|nr:transposase [Streptomyces sp. HNM0574]
MAAPGATAPTRPHEARHTPVSAFVRRIFGYLPRADQQRTAETYLRGLLSAPGRKTVRQMAQTLCPASPNTSQSLQQFISSSPWDWLPACAGLALLAAENRPVEAWTSSMVVVEKRGEHTVGVHRRYVPDAGRTLNCQVGIGLFVVSGTACVPVAWRLVMDEKWFGEEQRERARIPDSAHYRSAPAHLLEMVDWLARLRISHPVPLVVTRPLSADARPVADRLSERGLPFVLAVHPGQPVTHASPTRPDAPQQPLAAHRLTSPAGEPRTVTLGPRGALSTPVRLPGARRAPRTYLLVTEHATGGHWLTNLPAHRLDEVLDHIGRSALTSATVRTLEQDFGLLDFQGRSFPGWHHHTTMASAAYHYRHLHTPPHGTPAPGAVLEGLAR